MMMLNTGVQGAKRQTWQEKNYRELVKLIHEKNPGLDQGQGLALYLEEIQKRANDRYHLSALEYSYDSGFNALFSRRSPRVLASAEELAAVSDAAAQRVRAVVQRQAEIILLDMPMPNGKALRDCTGKECAKAGGWLSKIAGRIKPTDIVGKVLSEADVRKLWR